MSSSNNTAETSAGSGDALLEVGRIERVHGLRGELVVSLVTNMVDARTSPGQRLLAGDAWLTVVGARRHKNRWLMRFSGIDDRDRAEELRGRMLLAEPLPTIDGGEPGIVAFVHELIGSRLVDRDGRDHGLVVSVVDNPASDLLELEDGRLIPLTFYVDHDDETVTVDPPPGLLDPSAALDDRPGFDDR